MPDYLILMHDDVDDPADDGSTGWQSYIERLQALGNFQGGSAIGDGTCLRKSGRAAALTSHLAGYIRIEADSLAHAGKLVSGNPVYEAGGTVEIRELPKTD